MRDHKVYGSLNIPNGRINLLRVLALSVVGLAAIIIILMIGAGVYIQGKLDSSVLEACKNAFDIHVTNLGDAERPNLLISGLSSESFASIGRMSTEVDSSTLIVLLHLSLPLLGESPYFNEQVKLSSQIENVQFGLDKTEIWSRTAPTSTAFGGC